MRRWLIVSVLILAGMMPALPVHAATSSSTSLSSSSLEGIPRYDHVVTIVLENENFAATWSTPGPGGVPTYLQSLRKSGAFATEYFGVSHVSADNYIAMTSGQFPTPLFNADCLVSWGLCELFEQLLPDHGRNIGDQVDASHQTWRAYMDAMKVPCQHPALTAIPDPYQTGYATRHDPFVYYPTIVGTPARCDSHVVPFSAAAADFATAATTPAYAFITPDTCHDGHDTPCSTPDTGPGGLASANAWLQSVVPLILGSDAFKTQRSLLLITFDENGISDIQGCCGILAGAGLTSTSLAIGGRVGLLAIGTGVTGGRVITTPYDHWSYLRTVEDALGISEHLNVAGLPITKPMANVLR